MLLEPVKQREIGNRLGVLSKLESCMMKEVVFVGNRAVFLAPTRVGHMCDMYKVPAWLPLLEDVISHRLGTSVSWKMVAKFREKALNQGQKVCTKAGSICIER